MTIDVAGVATPVPLPVPASHADLLDRGLRGVLTTVDGHGAPRSSLVLLGRDGDDATATIPAASAHARDLRTNPRASLLAVDPADTTRCLQLRGDAEPRAAPGTTDHGTTVTVRLRARRVVLDAIFR